MPKLNATIDQKNPLLTIEQPEEQIEPGATDAPFSDPLLDSNPAVKKYQEIETEQIIERVPVPIFQAPPMTFDLDAPPENLDAQPATDSAQPEVTPPVASSREPLNPVMNEMSSKEKSTASDLAVDSAIGGYKLLCEQGLGYIASINPKKIEKLISAGELNEKAEFQADAEGTMTTIRPYVEEFNAVAADAFKVDDTFVNTIRPPLKRIFEKRGIGLSDEQFVAKEVFIDLGKKAFTAIQLKGMTNAIVESLKEQTQMMKNNNANKAPGNNNHKDNNVSPPPTEPNPVYEPKKDDHSKGENTNTRSSFNFEVDLNESSAGTAHVVGKTVIVEPSADQYKKMDEIADELNLPKPTKAAASDLIEMQKTAKIKKYGKNQDPNQPENR